MTIRHIVLVNASTAQIADSDVAAVAQALQTQVDRDFGPQWGIQGPDQFPCRRGLLFPAARGPCVLWMCRGRPGNPPG